MNEKVSDGDATQLPFVAPCRILPALAPLGWLRQRLARHVGRTAAEPHLRRDRRRAEPRTRHDRRARSAVTSNCWRWCRASSWWRRCWRSGTYVISIHLERGEKPSLRRCLREEQRAVGNLMVFALMLMVVFLVWARAGSAVHVFFPISEATGWRDYLTFFGIGSAIGSIFAAVVFSAAAFSLPMLVDRKVDTVTAVVTSVNAVLRNKPAMAVWAACIVLAVAPGFALLFIGQRARRRARLGHDGAGPHAAADRARHLAWLPGDGGCGQWPPNEAMGGA